MTTLVPVLPISSFFFSFFKKRGLHGVHRAVVNAGHLADGPAFVPIVSEAKRSSDTSSYTRGRLRPAIILRAAVLHARLKNRSTSRLLALLNRRLASAL